MLLGPQKDLQDKVALSRSAQPGFLDMLQKYLLFLDKLFHWLSHKQCLFDSLSLGISFRYGNAASKLRKPGARAVTPFDNVERTLCQAEIDFLDRFWNSTERGKMTFKGRDIQAGEAPRKGGLG